MNNEIVKHVLNLIANGNNPSEVAEKANIEMNKVFEIKAKYYLKNGKVLANFSVL